MDEVWKGKTIIELIIAKLMLREGTLTLRPLQEEDAQILSTLINNRNILDNLRDYIPYPYSLSDAISFISLSQNETPKMTFAIIHEEHFCGVIGLVGLSDVYRRTAEIGYWIGEPFWNHGIATMAVRLLTDYGLNELSFLRIHTGVFEYNTASMQVLAKTGYVKDGVFKKSVEKNGQIFDEHRFSITT